MKVPFAFYLHSDKEDWWEAINDALANAGVSDDEAERISQRARNPFYEIEFDCVLDTETGEVTYTAKR